MSHSRKRSPVYKDRPYKHAKRLANKRIRKCHNVASYNAYKRIFNSYEIHDYRSYAGNFLLYCRKRRRWNLYDKEELWKEDYLNDYVRK